MDTRLLRLAFKFPWLFAITIICAEIGAILLVLQLKLTAFFFNGLIFTKLPNSDLLRVLPFLIFFVIMKALFLLGENLSAGRMAVQIKSGLREWLSKKCIELESLDGKSSAEVQTIFLDDVEAVDAYFSQYLPQIIVSVFVPITFLSIVFPLDLLSGIIFFVTIPLIPFFMILIGKSAAERNLRQFSKLYQMSSFFLDSIQGIKTLILYNQVSTHQQRIETVSEDYRKATMDVLRISFLSAFTLELISTISTAVIAVQVGLRLLYWRMDFESAFLVLLIAPEIYLPLRNLGLRFHAAMNGVAGATNIFKFLEKKPVELGFPEKKITTLRNARSLHFRDVSVQYPDGVLALDHLNATFRFGIHSAIVGPSGAGKSTIFQLIMKFLQATGGEILLDELRLPQISKDGWRKQIGWLPQNPLLINGSIRENLLADQSVATEEKLLQVLAEVDLLEMVSHLPNGLESGLHEFKRGLSRGERQRLGLARILLRNPDLLLLDEPTAALDPISEAVVLMAISNLPRSTTIITIAHRLHTIRNADQIFFLNQGKLQGVGVHQNLLNTNFEYKNFCLAYFGQEI